MVRLQVIIVSDDDDPHARSVLDQLRNSGVKAVHYNASNVRSTLIRHDSATTRLFIDGVWHEIGPATSVWWRREGTPNVDDLDEEEAQLARDEVPDVLYGVLSAAGVRWIDEPSTIKRAEVKLHQVAVARHLGYATPETLLTNEESLAQPFARDRSVVVKALSSGFGIAPYVEVVSPTDVSSVSSLPSLLQELILDATADLRIVVVGANAWTWRRPREDATIDWRAEDPNGESFVRVQDADLELKAMRMTAVLGLSMSAQDWLETPRGQIFLEANPQGAWLFLREAEVSILPALVAHLIEEQETTGRWPKAIERFRFDFRAASGAPPDDGVVAPTFPKPEWIREVSLHPLALEVARRAHDEAKAGAKAAEEKASRLLQTTLALLTIAIGLAVYQVDAVRSNSWTWIFSLLPVAAAIVCFALAAFEAAQIDRVGVYNYPSVGDLVGLSESDAVAAIVAEEELGRSLARWSSQKKHTDLMQARAWFSRALAALIISGVLAAALRAINETPPRSDSRPARSPSPASTR